MRREPFAGEAAALLLLITLATLACQGQPVPLSAARGTTLTIPLGSGGHAGEGVLMGYGTEGDPDYQRGRLRLWLDAEPDPVELTVRGIARVSPDAASRAGLSMGSAQFELGGQVVVMVDIPTDAPLGTWPLDAARHLYEWNAGTETWVEQGTSEPVIDYVYELEVLPEGSRGPTPFEAFRYPSYHDVSDEVLDFKPFPKFRFGFLGGGVGALRFSVTYPPAVRPSTPSSRSRSPGTRRTGRTTG